MCAKLHANFALIISNFRANSTGSDSLFAIPVRQNRDSYAVLKALSSSQLKRTIGCVHDLKFRPLRCFGPGKQLNLILAGKNVAKWYINKHPYHFRYNLSENKNFAPESLYDSSMPHLENLRDAVERQNPQRAQFYYEQLKKTSVEIEPPLLSKLVALVSFNNISCEDFPKSSNYYIFKILSAANLKDFDKVEDYFHELDLTQKIPTVVYNCYLTAVLLKTNNLREILKVSDTVLHQMVENKVICNEGTLNAILHNIVRLKMSNDLGVCCALSLINQFMTLGIDCFGTSTIIHVCRIAYTMNYYESPIRDRLVNFFFRAVTVRQYLLNDSMDHHFLDIVLEMGLRLKDYILIQTIFRVFMHGTNSYLCVEDFTTTSSKFSLKLINSMISIAPLDIVVDAMDILNKKGELNQKLNFSYLMMRIINENGQHLLPRIFNIVINHDRFLKVMAIDCMQQVVNPSEELKVKFGECVEKFVEFMATGTSVVSINQLKVMECCIKLMKEGGKTKYLNIMNDIINELKDESAFFESEY